MGRLNAAQPVTLAFRSASYIKTVTLTLAEDGSFSVTDLPHKFYDLHVKGSKWLAWNLQANAFDHDVTGVQVALRPGDVNDDNTVDVADLSLLADAFFTSPGDVAWNENADFTCE